MPDSDTPHFNPLTAMPTFVTTAHDALTFTITETIRFLGI